MSIDAYGLAWLVVFGAGLATLAFWFLLTRPVPWFWLRTTLRCVVAGWLLLPAPVPNYPGQYAPAFVVALFELVFQKEGQPAQALQILLLGTVIILFLLAIPALFGLLRRGRQPSA